MVPGPYTNESNGPCLSRAANIDNSLLPIVSLALTNVKLILQFLLSLKWSYSPEKMEGTFWGNIIFSIEIMTKGYNPTTITK